MPYYLSANVALKHLELPSVYHIRHDELYELDAESFAVLRECSTKMGCEIADSDFLSYCIEEGVLTTSKSASSHPPVQQSPTPSLRYLELQITDRCNLTCRHCYIGDTVSNELTLQQIHGICSEFEELQGLRLLVTGGEPLMHRSFDEINKVLSSFAFRKVLFTNGLLLTDRILKDLNVEEIQISIDGMEQGHDSLRGTGTFRKALDALRKARQAGFDVSVSTMVHADNLPEFNAMDSLFRETGVKDWTVDVPCVTGRLAGNPALQITPETGGKYLSYGFGEGLHGGESGYGCGLHLMAVMADGKAAKCTFYGDRSVGMIDEGLRTCWERISPVRISDLSCDCAFIDSCRGGCRYRAELCGDRFGKDLYRCCFHDIIR